ncbi:hypothetical protein Tco_0211334 [Tanacetum coccineum]
MRETDPLDKLAKIVPKGGVTRHGYPSQSLRSLPPDSHQISGGTSETHLELYVGLNLEKHQILGPDLIQETTEKFIAESSKGLPARRRDRQRRVVRFGKRGKLNPRYVGPFKVIERVGEVLTSCELPEELSRVHNTAVKLNVEAKSNPNSPKFDEDSKGGLRHTPTWEREDQFKKKHPHLFTKTASSSSGCNREP